MCLGSVDIPSCRWDFRGLSPFPYDDRPRWTRENARGQNGSLAGRACNPPGFPVQSRSRPKGRDRCAGDATESEVLSCKAFIISYTLQCRVVKNYSFTDYKIPGVVRSMWSMLSTVLPCMIVTSAPVCFTSPVSRSGAYKPAVGRIPISREQSEAWIRRTGQ